MVLPGLTRCLLVATLICGLPAAADVFHVNPGHPDSSDSNNGSESRPWKTLSKAVLAVSSGDTVMIHPGTYRESFETERNGSSSSPIVWEGTTGNPKDVRVTAYEALTGVSFTPVTEVGGHSLSATWRYTEAEGPGVVTAMYTPTYDAEIYLSYDENGDGGGADLTWDQYLQIEVGCSSNYVPCAADETEAIRMVDAIEGSWYRNGTHVYFHNFKDADPRDIELEIGRRDFPCQWLKDHNHYRNISCWAADSWAIYGSGDGAILENVEAHMSKIGVGGTSGLNGFVLRDCKGYGSIKIEGSSSVNDADGMTIERCQARGGRGGSLIGIDRVTASSWSSAIVIRDNLLHNGFTRKEESISYDWTCDCWTDPAQEKRSSHGLYIGQNGADFQYFIVERNVILRSLDGLGVFGCNNVRVWNNTFGDDDSHELATKKQHVYLRDVQNLDMKNNLFYAAASTSDPFFIGELTPPGSSYTSDYNVFFHPNWKGKSSKIYDRDVNWSLAEAQANGKELHSIELDSNSGGHCFVDPRHGVNDFRLEACSPAIDRGLNSACANPVEGEGCDVGMDEFGGGGPPDSTPPAPIADLSAENPGPASVQLAWTESSDDGDAQGSGTVSSYEARYSTAPIDASNFAGAQVIDTSAWVPLAPGARHTETIPGLDPETLYYFAVKSLDERGNTSGVSNSPSATTAPAPPPPPDVQNLRRGDTN